MNLFNQTYQKACLRSLILLFLAVWLGGCAKPIRFTFTGTSLPPEIKSVTIVNFFNDASEGPANLATTFTEELRDYFQRNTKLEQVPAGGDLQLEGKISSLNVRPVAAGAGELQGAQLQRLTITVEVEFTNHYDDEQSFKRSFSSYSDFDANQNLADVEDEKVDEIFEQVIFDIFNQTVANW
ncbi:LptE family protein [Rapidithrix thailandica]|uniref:LptE family protein n=1 Tax=Rapidithrix thailandica TaxID=413964 RepID=A0AAW9RWC0_9BACT